MRWKGGYIVVTTTPENIGGSVTWQSKVTCNNTSPLAALPSDNKTKPVVQVRLHSCDDAPAYRWCSHVVMHKSDAQQMARITLSTCVDDRESTITAVRHSKTGKALFSDLIHTGLKIDNLISCIRSKSLSWPNIPNTKFREPIRR